MIGITSPGRAHLRPPVLGAVLIVLLTAGMTHVGRAESNHPGISIHNFGEINTNYYRGGQPDFEGFKALKQLGIKTVIDLQQQGRKEEAAWVQRSGMQYFNIPLSALHPATEAQTEQFLKLVNDPQNWPVYVHCQAGRHRSGEMTAIYRITHDSWDADKAYQEMKRYGFYSLFGTGSLRDYVYLYYEKHRSTLATTSGSAAVAK